MPPKKGERRAPSWGPSFRDVPKPMDLLWRLKGTMRLEKLIDFCGIKQIDYGCVE